MTEAVDYVVVGGGSAGCVAAARLAEDPQVRVLVLEAGPPAEEHPETLHADGYPDAFANDAVIHERFSVPQAGCGGRRIFVGSGSVVGGSGAVNGMVYTRGAREDYAEWPEGWRWEDVVPDFEAIEARLRSRQRPPTRWTEACVSAAVTCGFRRRDDLNDGDLRDAVGYEWMTYEGDHRRSSYVAFLAGAGPNLEVRTRATAHRIVIDGDRRAVAVEYAEGDRLRRVDVTREVVLCAGAIETPKLLMLSGCAAGGVGENLHDHPNVPLFFLVREQVDCTHPQLYSFHGNCCYVYWPARSAMKQSLQRMLPGMLLPPDLYDGPLNAAIRGAVDGAFRLRAVGSLVARLYGIVVILGKPASRGTVRLASRDPRAPALVDPAYLTDPSDVDTLAAGVRLARRLAGSAGLRAWGSRELTPGRWRASDESLERWLRANVITTYHFAGTCRMGSVCDERLRVRGVTGVRIADASVIPVAPVAALNAPSMLIGYRAARFIREERSDPS